MKWYRRLGVTIPLISLLLALVPLIVFGVNATRKAELALMQNIHQSNRIAIRYAILQTEILIQHTLEGMSIAANTLGLNDMDELDAQYALQLIQKEIPQLQSLALLDKSGKETAKLSLDNIYRNSELTSRDQTPEFTQTNKNRPYIGQVKTSDTGSRRLTLAIPLLDPRDRTVYGVLTAEASIRNLLEEIPSMDVGHGGFVYVVDPKGKIIAHPDLSRVLSGQSITENSHFQHFLEGEKEHIEELHRHVNPDGADVLSMGIESKKLGWVFMVEQPAAQALISVNTLSRELKISLAILVTLAVAGALYLVFGFSRPLKKLQSAAVSLSAGNLDQQVDIDSRNEIGLVAREFNRMLENLSKTARKQRRMDWLKTGQVELDNHIRSNQTMQALTRSIITFLAKYLDARVGAFYVRESDDTFRFQAGYAYQDRRGEADIFNLGESLIGQAALDGKPILLESVPEDYIQIVSGLGETNSAGLIVFPFIHEGTAVGVMELGFLEAASETKRDFLIDISERVAIALISIQERERLQETLQVSQNQAEELEVQQEELRAANEELEELTRTLRARESDS